MASSSLSSSSSTIKSSTSRATKAYDAEVELFNKLHFFQYKNYQALNDAAVTDLQQQCETRNTLRTTTSTSPHEYLVENLFHPSLEARYTLVETKHDLICLIMHRLLRPYRNTIAAVRFDVGSVKYLLVDAVASVRVKINVRTFAHAYGMLVVRDLGNETYRRLSPREWSEVSTSEGFSLDGARFVLIPGKLALARVRGHDDQRTLSTSYFDVHYRQELKDIRAAFFSSTVLLSLIRSQAYLPLDKVIRASQFEDFSVFMIDLYPHIASDQARQHRASKWLLGNVAETKIARIFEPAYENAIFDTDKHDAQYYQVFTKAFVINGTPTVLYSTLRRLKTKDDVFAARPDLAFNEHSAGILRQLQATARATYPHVQRSQASLDTAFYVLAFVHDLFYDVNIFKDKGSIPKWLQSFAQPGVAEARLNLIWQKRNNAVDTVIMKPVILIFNLAIVTSTPDRLMALSDWYLYDKFVPYGGSMTDKQERETLSVAPTSAFSKFMLKKTSAVGTYETEVSKVCTAIFAKLDVNTGRVDRDEEFTESTSAVMESCLIMESVFGESFDTTSSRAFLTENGHELLRKFVFAGQRTSVEHRPEWQSYLLHDVRTCIAAWLLVFKLIVKYSIDNTKIANLLLSLRARMRSRTPTTQQEEDYSYFYAIFGVSIPWCPYTAALVPTIYDLRRHITRQYANVLDSEITAPFTSIYNFMQKDFLLLNDQRANINEGNVRLVNDLYPHEIDVQRLVPVVRLGAWQFSMDDVSASLNKFIDAFKDGKIASVDKKEQELLEHIAEYDKIVDDTVSSAVVTSIQYENNVDFHTVARYVAESDEERALVDKFRKQNVAKAGLDLQDFVYLLWLLQSSYYHEGAWGAIATHNYFAHLVRVYARRGSLMPTFFDEGFFDMRNILNNGVFGILYSDHIKSESHLSDFYHAFSFRRTLLAPLAVSYASRDHAQPMRPCVRSPLSLPRHFASRKISIVTHDFKPVQDLQFNEELLRIITAVSDVPSYEYLTTAYAESVSNWFNFMYLLRENMPINVENTHTYEETIDITRKFVVGQMSWPIQHTQLYTMTSRDVSDYAEKLHGHEYPLTNRMENTQFMFTMNAQQRLQSKLFDKLTLFNTLRTYLLATLGKDTERVFDSLFTRTEYYAPIDTYITARADGPRSFDMKSGYYHRASRRVLFNSRLESISKWFCNTGTTIIPDGYSTGDARMFVRMEETTKPHAIVFEKNSQQHCVIAEGLQAGQDDFGALTGEVSEIAFEVVGNVVDMTPDELRDYLTETLNPDTLYPVDEFAWFQFSHVSDLTSVPATAYVSPTLGKGGVISRPTPSAKRPAQPSNARPSKEARKDAQYYYQDVNMSIFQLNYDEFMRALIDPARQLSGVFASFFNSFIDEYIEHVLKPAYSGVTFLTSSFFEAVRRQYGSATVQPRDTADYALINSIDFTSSSSNASTIIVLPIVIDGYWLLFTHNADGTSRCYTQMLGEVAIYINMLWNMLEDRGFERAETTVIALREDTRAFNDRTAFLRLLSFVHWRLDNSDGYATDAIVDVVNGPPTSYLSLMTELAVQSPSLRAYDPVYADRPDPSVIAFILSDKGELDGDVIAWWCTFLNSRSTSTVIIDNQQQAAIELFSMLYYARSESQSRVYMLWRIVTPGYISWTLIEIDLLNKIARNYYAYQEHPQEAALFNAFTRLAALIDPVSPSSAWTFQYNVNGIDQNSAAYSAEFCAMMLFLLVSGRSQTFTVDQVREQNIRARIYEDIRSISNDDYNNAIDTAAAVQATANFEELPSLDFGDLFEMNDDDSFALPAPPTIPANVPEMPIKSVTSEQPSSSSSSSLMMNSNATLPKCILHGYEINAQKFGNSLRYVRYTREQERANAVFSRVARPASKLSYWRLKATRNTVEAAPTEVLVTYPQGEWPAFLFTGYPHRFDTIFAGSKYLNDCYGVKAAITPLSISIQARMQYVSSPMPIFPPRMYSEPVDYREQYAPERTVNDGDDEESEEDGDVIDDVDLPVATPAFAIVDDLVHITNDDNNAITDFDIVNAVDDDDDSGEDGIYDFVVPATPTIPDVAM